MATWWLDPWVPWGAWDTAAKRADRARVFRCLNGTIFLFKAPVCPPLFEIYGPAPRAWADLARDAMTGPPPARRGFGR